MSRAINIQAPQDAVTDLCTKFSIRISTIEPLQSGGTRVVLLTSDGADTVRHHMRKKIIDGPVVRGGLYVSRHMQPTSRR
jgi:hypothetical protein